MTPTIREPNIPGMYGALREAAIEVTLRNGPGTRSNPEMLAAAYTMAAEMLRSGKWHGGITRLYHSGRGDKRRDYMQIEFWQPVREGEASTFFTGSVPITE